MHESDSNWFGLMASCHLIGCVMPEKRFKGPHSVDPPLGTLHPHALPCERDWKPTVDATNLAVGTYGGVSEHLS